MIAGTCKLCRKDVRLKAVNGIAEYVPCSSSTCPFAPVNLPFERVPCHAGDPGFGPVPPESANEC
jgi:hypothetical protein